MTCRERLAIEHPEHIDEKYFGGCCDCPADYGYMEDPDYCDPNDPAACKRCWSRKLPKGKEAEPETAGALPDSGERTVFETGAVRDMHEGKGRCDLLPACVLLRLARHYERGAVKYGPHNWTKGIPCHSFADSALRHLLKYMDGQTDEDHLIAAIWNLCGLAWTEEKKPELMDIPERRTGDDTGTGG